MTRKSAVLVCLTLIGAVPGCLQVPNFGGAAAEGPKKVYDRAWTQPEAPAKAAKPTHSTALVGLESEKVASKLPAGPDAAPGPLAVQSVEVEPLPALDHRPEAKPLPAPGNRPEAKLAAGNIGTVTIPEAPTPSPVKTTSLETQVASVAGKDPEPDMEAAVRAFHLVVVGKHQEAIKALNGYDDSTQEFFIRMFPLLAQIARTSIDKMSAQERIALYDQVKGVDVWLRTRCELLVTKMVYCKRINGFADIEPLPADHAFLARTENRPGDLVQLYVELRNFASKQTKEGDFLTRLSCSLELRDMQGQKVWSHAFDKNETTYRKSACVTDYHGNFSFYVPALPPGTYQLTLQVVDETMPEQRIRVARKAHVFRVTPVASQLAPR